MNFWSQRNRRRKSRRNPWQTVLERLEDRTLLAAPTVANAVADQTATVGQAFSFSIPTNTFTDSDVGDAITLSAIGVPAGLTFTAGPASASPTGSFTGTPTAAGIFSVAVTGTAAGESVSDIFTITVSANGVPTVATVIADQTATVGQAFSFSIPTNTFTDPEGDAITLSAIGVPAGLTFTAGPASANPTGSFTGTPTAAGTFSVAVTATATGGSVSDTFIITISANGVPTVANVIADQTADVGQTFSFTIPTNTFTDPEGDAITLSAIGLPAGLTFTAGPASANPTGNFSGTPTTAGTFNVTVTGTSTGGSVSDTFTITVSANGAPTVANVIADQTADVGQTFSFTIPTNTFTDPEGDAITLSAIGLPAGLTFTAGPASANPTGNFTGTPTTAGTFSVTVTGTATGGSVSNTFTITVSANGSPTVTAITNQTATVGQPFSFAIPTTVFTDPEGDAITLSAIGVPAGLTFTSGPASANPTGNFTGTPTTAGTFSVTVTGASTGGSVSTTFTITVSAANQPPMVANALADRTVGVNQAVSFTIPTNTFTDPEGNAIMLTATGLPQGIMFNAGGPSANPTGTFSGAAIETGTFNVTITASATGGSVSDTFVITVVAVNLAPSFSLPSDPDPTVLNVPINSPAQTFLYFAKDISAGPNETQTVDFIATNDNPGLFTVQPAIDTNGTLTFTPAAGAFGTATVTVQIHDNGGIANGGDDTSDPQTFTINIGAFPKGTPVANPNPRYTVPAGAKVRAFVVDGELIVQFNGVPQQFYEPALIETLAILGGSKNDEIDLTGLMDDLGGTLYTALTNVVIKAGAGNDRVVGSFADDSIDGGSGNDTLSGGFGDDILIGNAGTDLLTESADEDMMLTDTTLTGGLGNDRILTIEKAFLIGGDGANEIDASGFKKGAVTLLGGAGNDILKGGEKNDLILGEDGNDELFGGKGNDTVLGGFGEDTLNGDEGADLLIGGFDDDTLVGGAGRDTVVGGNGGAARGGEGVADDVDDRDDVSNEVINEAFKKLFAFE